MTRQIWKNHPKFNSLLARAACFVFVHATFEDLLNDFCRNLKSEKNCVESIEHTPGKGIERAKCYLLKVGAMFLPDCGDWNTLTALQAARNCITHAGGYVKDESVAKLGAAKKLGITVTGKRLRLSETTLVGQIDCLEVFLRNLIIAANWEFSA